MTSQKDFLPQGNIKVGDVFNQRFKVIQPLNVTRFEQSYMVYDLKDEEAEKLYNYFHNYISSKNFRPNYFKSFYY
jgi:hypothetical protein